MTEIRIGIAGLGRSGWDIHVKALRSMADKFKIVAVTDSEVARCAEASAEFGCRTYSELAGLLKDSNVELVVVATPNRKHPEHAILAMRVGKHVVCEKPMAADVAEADGMIEAARQTGRTLAVFQNMRYRPDFLKVRDIIRSGVLGRIVMIKIHYQHTFARRWDWQTLKEFGGGTLNNTGPHAIDQALQLFGPAEPRITCHLERALTSGDAEDHCKVLFQGPGLPMIDLELSSVCAYPQDLWLVMGTQGGLKGTLTRLEWKYVDWSALPPRPVLRQSTPDRSYNQETLPWQEDRWERPLDYPGEVIGFYDDLYKTIREGAPLVITPESVRRQIAVLQTCHELCPL
jgi:scyllo-inositol 2-dehydrogenase (NADP+)